MGGFVIVQDPENAAGQIFEKTDRTPISSFELREEDLNLRLLGYEPSELPTALSHHEPRGGRPRGNVSQQERSQSWLLLT